jgi:hypothetical protein
MELPNYFLADLPDSSTLTPQLITDACQTLKQNRARFLVRETTEELIETVASLAREWLEPGFPFRKLVLEKAPAHTGFGPKTIASGLDDLFGQITSEGLHSLIVQDLGSSRRLDEFIATEPERKQNRSSITRGPELLVQITGGVLPNPTVTSLILGLLARSAQFVKCATGTSFIPRIFAHSLYAARPKLGACIEIAEWKGGNDALEAALFAETSCLTATGSAETLRAIRGKLPADVRFVGYGHKLSFAYVTREALEKPETLFTAIGRDVTAWNQLGCLSPHAIWVETGGPIDPDQVASQIAGELHLREPSDPRGTIPPHTAADIASRRMVYQARAASDGSTKIWASEQSTAWTVVHDTSREFPISCLHRFIHVKPVENLEHFLRNLEPLRGRISTVGLAAPTARVQELAARFAEIGVTRVCRAGQMQNPPLSWRHDGRPSLGDLVTWTDIEF